MFQLPEYILNEILNETMRQVEAHERWQQQFAEQDRSTDETVQFKIHRPSPSDYPEDMIVDGTVSPIPKEIEA